MSSTRSRPQARLPLLDRLLDDGDGGRSEPSAQAARDSLRRDLELLFNTRPRQRSVPAHLSELQTSVLTYGMPDLQTRPMADEAQREAFRLQFEAIVRRFEPRLRDVKVDMAPMADRLDRTLRFRIRAIFHTEAGDDPIIYDTTLDPTSRNLLVTDSPVEDA